MMMKLYLFNLLPVQLACFGGGGKPADPPPPPPPPQLAKTPQAAAVRADTAMQNVAQGGGAPKSTLLTGGMGEEIDKNKLGKKTLLGGGQ